MVFWFSNFVWDFIIYMIVATALAVILYLFDERMTLHNNDGFGTLIFLYTLLGFAGIPWAYILSFPFKSAPSAYAILIITTIVTGVVGPLATFFLRRFYDPDEMSTNLAMISDIVRYILTWLGPFFPFGRSFLGFINIQETNARCVNQVKIDQLETACELFHNDPGSYFSGQNAQSNQQTAACCDSRWGVQPEYAICGTYLQTASKNYTIHKCVEQDSFWTFDLILGINIDVIILCIDIVLFWIILALIETNILSKAWTKIKESYYGKTVVRPTNIDDDVKKEQESVYNNNDNLMRIINLSKRFNKFDAVRGLSFGVRRNECFGLLGVNGAGKTTTFRMVTGDEIMTTGSCFIGDVSLTTNRSEYLQSIGYCPQFDSIIEVTNHHILHPSSFIFHHSSFFL